MFRKSRPGMGGRAIFDRLKREQIKERQLESAYFRSFAPPGALDSEVQCAPRSILINRFPVCVLMYAMGNEKCEKEEKGVWRMPRLSQAMKDVTSCDKPREGANGR